MIGAGRAEDPVLRRLAALMGRERWWIAAAAALSVVTLGAGIGLISLSGYLISRSALVDSTVTLTLVIVGVRFFAVLRAVGRYFERYVGHLATFRMLTRLRVWFFLGIEPRAPATLLDERPGDVLTRIVDDVETLQDLPLRVIVPRTAAVLAGATGATVVGVLDPLLGVVLAVALLACGVALPLLTRRLGRAASRALVAEQAAMNAAVVEGVSALADLVAYGREDLLTGRVAERTRRRQSAERDLASLRGINAGMAGVLAGSAALVMVALAIMLVREGRLDGVLLAVVPLTALAAFEAVAPLAVSYEHLDRGRAAAARLFELVDRPVTVVEPSHPPQQQPSGLGQVEFDAVTFAYRPGRPDVLTDATFTVPAGADVAVVGPSGSGKSTIPALLLRFWQPQQGAIRLDGIDLRDIGSSVARATVAVVAQRDHLFDTTIRDNLLLGDADADDERLWEALRAVALDDFLRSLPAGLDERAGADGGRFSGGERQRLMIARALLTDAPVLVLDEATAHLDAETERRVLSGVRAWRPGMTTIHIAHHATSIGQPDLVLSVVGGSVTVTTPNGRAPGTSFVPSKP